LNYDWKIDYESHLDDKEVVTRYQRTKGFNKKNNVLIKEFMYEIHKNKSLKKVHNVTAHIKVVDFYKLKRLIDKAGLKIIKEWNSYDFSDKLITKKCILCLGKK